MKLSLETLLYVIGVLSILLALLFAPASPLTILCLVALLVSVIAIFLTSQIASFEKSPEGNTVKGSIFAERKSALTKRKPLSRFAWFAIWSIPVAWITSAVLFATAIVAATNDDALSKGVAHCFLGVWIILGIAHVVLMVVMVIEKLWALLWLFPFSLLLYVYLTFN